MIKLSIITPTYGRTLLKVLVKELLSQTHQNFEHLIIADGTNDQVREFVEGLKDSRFKYLYTSPTRDYGNVQRNYGLMEAIGEYGIFLDDDVQLLSNRYLEELISILDGNSRLVFAVVPVYHEVQGKVLHKSFRHCEIDMMQFMFRLKDAKKIGFSMKGYATEEKFLMSLLNNTVVGYFKGDRPLGIWRRKEVRKMAKVIKKFIRLEDTQAVYGVAGRYKKIFPDKETFFAYGGTWDKVIVVTQKEFDRYITAKPFRSIT